MIFQVISPWIKYRTILTCISDHIVTLLSNHVIYLRGKDEKELDLKMNKKTLLVFL